MIYCPVCNSNKTKKSFDLEFYTTTNPINTNIYICKNCKIYFRIFKNNFNLNDHFLASSYTDISSEENYLKERNMFFKQIIKLAENNHPTNNNQHLGGTLLDFGCSYGHLLDIATMKGFHCKGVELIDHLRERLKLKYDVYYTTSEIKDNIFDVITSIDSLYYCTDIIGQMQEFHRILKKDGLLIIRICNRNYFINILRLLKRKITPKIFGDQLISMNHKSFKILSEKTGFEIKKVIYYQKGINIKRILLWVGYKIFPLICKITGLKLTPGIIYVLCKHED